MDDEKVAYLGYEKMQKAGIKNVCVHKGLFPPSLDNVFPKLRPYADVSDVGKVARDWPQLNFIIYHSGYRNVGGEGANAVEAWTRVEKKGRNDWVTDLAEIPAKYGVSNVYGDLGQLFAASTVAQPKLAAYLVGCLVNGLGADHVVWGTDALWTGSPQWQIEGLRRLEIPEDMQKRFGFRPLGASVNSSFSGQTGGSTSNLLEVQTLDGRFLSRNSFRTGLGDFLHSSQQDLSLRTTLGGGYGRYLIRTNHNTLAWLGGVVYTHENFESSDQPADQNVEALLGLQYELFRFARYSLQSQLLIYPGLTDAGRIRATTKTTFSMKLVNNFHTDFSLLDNFDSRPPFNAKRNGLSISNTLGWTF
jgi:hypothetical protein